MTLTRPLLENSITWLREIALVAAAASLPFPWMKYPKRMTERLKAPEAFYSNEK
jgi:hypothetical protein